jgi:hypothetical protein|tara:strand:+ start:9877 stop:10137 length:261 start_codon:yes stop_codon:yes gene_type:complete
MIAELLCVTEQECNGGVAKQYKFTNGYGASVIRHKFSYGWDKGQWELAVTEGDDNELCYTTDITSNVIGYLSDEQVDDYLKQISLL